MDLKNYFLGIVAFTGVGLAWDLVINPTDREEAAAAERVAGALATGEQLNVGSNTLLTFNGDNMSRHPRIIVVQPPETEILADGVFRRLCADYTLDTGRLFDSKGRVCAPSTMTLEVR